jgi:DNA-binding NarL/FixJ family response regulator
MIKVLTYDKDAGRDAQINSTFALSNTIYPLTHNRNLGSLVDAVTCLKPDLLLLDSHHPVLPEPRAMKRLHRLFPELKVFLQLNDEGGRDIFEWLKMGIHGCVLRSESIRMILLGVDFIVSEGAFISPGVAARLMAGEDAGEGSVSSQGRLTAKEKEVLNLLSHGMSYKMISTQLNISYHTVSTHIRNMYQKKGVHSVTELLASCRSLVATDRIDDELLD